MVYESKKWQRGLTFPFVRILRWIYEEEDKLEAAGESSLQYVILAMGAVGNIDTSGISMLEEVKKSMERRGLKVIHYLINLNLQIPFKNTRQN